MSSLQHRNNDNKQYHSKKARITNASNLWQCCRRHFLSRQHIIMYRFKHMKQTFNSSVAHQSSYQLFFKEDSFVSSFLHCTAFFFFWHCLRFFIGTAFFFFWCFLGLAFFFFCCFWILAMTFCENLPLETFSVCFHKWSYFHRFSGLRIPLGRLEAKHFHEQNLVWTQKGTSQSPIN